MAWSQSTREIRAFDWVDYILYILATGWFAWLAFVLIRTGVPPESLSLKFGTAPSLKGQSDQALYEAVVFFVSVFVVFVYLRNYIVMHAIDDRKDGKHTQFYFVDYNFGLWSLAERVFRAMIVLWVLTTAIGAVPFVTNYIWTFLQFILSFFIDPVDFLEISSIEAFYVYYGFVVLVLFILFIIWDSINIISISNQMKMGSFNGCSFGADTDYKRVIGIRNLGFSIPDHYKSIIPIYSMVAYIRPRKIAIGDLGSADEENSSREKIRKSVSDGKLMSIYWAFSYKLIERFTGLSIGLALMFVPIVDDKSTLLITIIVMMGFYLSVMFSYGWETLKGVCFHFVDFPRYVALHWREPARAEVLGIENGIPPCGP
jgi:hypothetical protein